MDYVFSKLNMLLKVFAGDSNHFLAFTIKMPCSTALAFDNNSVTVCSIFMINSGPDQLGGCRECHQSVWTSCDSGRVSLTFYLDWIWIWNWMRLINRFSFLDDQLPTDPTLWLTWTLQSSSIIMVTRRELWISIRRWKGKSTCFETAVATLNLIRRYCRFPLLQVSQSQLLKL